jgi:hypothetical protein
VDGEAPRVRETCECASESALEVDEQRLATYGLTRDGEEVTFCGHHGHDCDCGGRYRETRGSMDVRIYVILD